MTTTTDAVLPANLTPPKVTTIQQPIDVNVIRTLPQLEATLYNRAHEALIEIARGIDLASTTYSVAVWLCPDGSVKAEVVKKKAWKVLPKERGAHLLEIFSAPAHATPSSRLHRWVHDNSGAFVGRANRELGERDSLWDAFSSKFVKTLIETREKVWTALLWSRFRLEPLSPGDVQTELESDRYRHDLDEGIETWLYSGKAAGLFSGLKLTSVKIGLSSKRRKFYRAIGGRERFDELLLQKYTEHLTEVLAETGGESIRKF